jgi:hypothetical protein
MGQVISGPLQRDLDMAQAAVVLGVARLVGKRTARRPAEHGANHGPRISSVP